MTSTISRDIDGYKFAFIYGNMFGNDGVIIAPLPPETFDSPVWQSAFKKARQLYITFEAVCLLSDFDQYSGRRLDTATIEELARYADAAKLALTQTDWELEPHEISGAYGLLQRVGEECLRRENKERRTVQKTSKQSSGRAGFVYLIQSPTDAYKIGRTVDPDDRLKTFSVKLPFPVEYICTIATDDMYKLESELHVKFADKRLNGEWFALSPEDVEYIRGLAT